MSKVALGADHAGLELKEKVKELLQNKGIQVEDLGTNSPDSVDYPDYATQVAKMVAEREADWGILVCKSGIGMSIAANKVRGVRAALCHSTDDAKLARGHNDANVLALSGAFTSPEEAQKIIETWISTPFEGGRHARRVEKVNKLDQKC